MNSKRFVKNVLCALIVVMNNSKKEEKKCERERGREENIVDIPIERKKKVGASDDFIKS